MKKLFAILLGLTLVLALSGIAAAATESFTGLVEVTFGDGNTDADPGPGFGGNKEAAVTFDYAKTFSETVVGGLKTMVVFDATDDGLGDTVKFDGAGFVTVKTDFADITAWTAIKGAAGNDIGTGDIDENPGVEVKVTAVEGLTLTGIINSTAAADATAAEYGFGDFDDNPTTADTWGIVTPAAAATFQYYNMLLKGSFVMDALTIGGGYSSIGLSDPEVEDSDAFTAFDVYGSYALEDLGLTVGAEYASRNLESLPETGAAYLVKASFTGVEGLTANFSYEAIDEFYGQTLSDDDFADIDPEDVTLKDMFKNMGAEGSVIDINGTYQLTEAIKVNAGYQMASWDPEEATQFDAGVEFKATEELTLTGSVQMVNIFDAAFLDMTTLTVGASYLLAEGVTLSGEFQSASGTILGTDYENTNYEVKIAATF